MTTPAPQPGKPWVCPRCRAEVGRVAHSGILTVTAVGTTVERARLAVVIRCACGMIRIWFGGVRIDDTPGADRDTLQSA